jgi:hypothetical protein
MAYVGCIAGAIGFEDYRRGLLDAGFSGVEVIDSGADLNAYAKVEGQAGCCSPAMGTAPESSGCCGGGMATAPEEPKRVSLSLAGCCSSPEAAKEPTLHERLADLLKRYDVNDYAASVKVFAVKR